MPRTDPRRFGPKVLTANHLLEGDVIYLSASGSWVRALAEAKLYFDADKAEAALRLAQSQANTVLSPYLVEMQPGKDGTPTPVHFRETFRKTGPSNRFHGKQADLQTKETSDVPILPV